MFEIFAKKLSRAADFLEKIVKTIAIAMLVTLISAVFFQVARRTVTGKSFVELEEFSIVLASWCAFFTLAYAVRKKVHVRIDVFTKKLSFLPYHILQLAILMTILFASIVLVRYGIQLGRNKMIVPMTVLPFKSGFWYFSFPAGMSFACFFLFEQIIQEISLLMAGEKTSNIVAKEVVEEEAR